MDNVFLNNKTFSNHHKGLREHDRRFAEYVEVQRRTNKRYFAVKCLLKYDFIRFSVYLNSKGKQPDESKLWALFTDIWLRRTREPKYSHLTSKNFKYHWKYNEATSYEFKFNDKIYELIISKCSYNHLYPYIITVHDPTKEILIYLKQFFDTLNHYHVKEIEHTFDFIFEDQQMVRQFLIQQTIIKWRGRGFQLDDCGTFYIANPRMAKGKGGRVYEKVLDAKKDSVRLELLLKRPILKRNGVETIEDVIDADSSTVTNYIHFKKFNFDKLKKRMQSKNYNSDEIDNEIDNVKNRIDNGELHEINKEHSKQFGKYQSDTFLKESFFWNHFKHEIARSSFLRRDVFKLSHALMMDELTK